jgi:hypothetical protein
MTDAEKMTVRVGRSRERKSRRSVGGDKVSSDSTISHNARAAPRERPTAATAIRDVKIENFI